jgi:hypothetical protein
MASVSQSLFLMNPANEPFIQKKAARPAFKDSSNLEIGIAAAVFVIVLILLGVTQLAQGEELDERDKPASHRG